MNWEVPDVQAGFRKDRSNFQYLRDHRKSKEFQKTIYFSFIDYTKAFDYVDHNRCGKFLNRGEYQTTLPASWEICMQFKKQQLELDMEQQTGSK